ncbi:glycosyltransferase [Arcticibacter sp.]|uniref:glycosyltransferase n=1 Tax=Arcticibacter sp. TaxID=1872630 RepID=UPI00388E5CF5
MRVVHLNTYDGNGGAGRACLRLHRALLAQGVQSEVWVYYKFGSNPQIQTFSGSLISRGLSAFAILFERYYSSYISKPLKIPFSASVCGKDITRNKAVQEADIIHIHWINHAFLRPEDLAGLSKLGKPVVWTFHDSNAFTGGCHVRYSCDHFENECGNCPILKNENPDDQSHKLWKRKRKAYQKLNFSIVAPSRWMHDSIRRSSLLKHSKVDVIPNTLETDIFRPWDKKAARKALGLPEDKFIMLSGFMPSRKDLHKGTPYLLEALQMLVDKSMVNKQEVELIIFGNKDTAQVPEFAVSTTFLGTISDDEKLSMCYSAADVFLTPSLEDNLPNTVMESLSCGTPVVAFTTGGIPDMVTHQENGYLAKYKSSDDFANGISWVYGHTDRNQLNIAAREAVMARFSEKVIAAKHVAVYNEVSGNAEPSTFRPLLSVITVVYNNVEDIERTVRSVINQTYQNIEYIVIDGGSTDGTLEALQRYAPKINRLVSEKDAGIYDAMNKGLALASGDYILFMNSGDEIYAPDTVANIFHSADNADIYYGETEMYNERWESLGRRRHQAPKRLTHSSFRYGMSVSHQAIYIKRAIAGPYDLQYQLSADIDWILSAIKKAHNIRYVDSYVAKYLVGGMSKQKHRQSLMERFQIFSKHYGTLPNIFYHVVITIKLAAYYLRHRRTND